MKKYWKRLASVATALSLCFSLLIPAAAIPSKDALDAGVTPIALSAQAQELKNGSYRVKYEADLTMSEIFAQAVVSLNTGDYLKQLEFTCVLEDDLVKQMELDDVSFTFAGEGAVNFIPDGANYISKGVNGELCIRYKLSPTAVDEFRYMRASQIEAALMQEVTVTSAEKIVPAAAIRAAEDGQGAISTSARVEITYAGGNIPIYDEPYILAAESGAVTMTVSGYEDSTPEIVTPVEPDPLQPVPVIPVAAPEETGVSAKLDTASVRPFMVGDDKGNFRPNANITRAEVAQVFYALLLDQDVEQSVTFLDVEKGAWYEDAVNTLAALGIVSGVGEGKFEPMRNITRAEFAVIAANFARKAPAIFSFADVPSDHWAYQHIMSAAAYGWVAGVGSSRYEPARNIQRSEAATIVNNMLLRVKNDTVFDTSVVIPDVDTNHWAYRYIAAAYGLIVP